MKTTLVTLIVLALSGARVFAGWPVTILADPFREVEFAKDASRWVEQFNQWKAQIDQATRVAKAAKTLQDFAGDPKLAVRNLSEVSGIITSLGRTFGEEETADAWAADVRAADSFSRSLDSLNSSASELGSTFTAGGKTYNRSPSLYQAVFALENATDGTRRIIAANRKTEEEILKKAEQAGQRLANAQTESEKQAAAADLQRLTLLHQAAASRTQAVAADLQLKEKLAQLEAQKRAKAEAEAVVADGQRYSAERDAAREEAQANINAGLKPVERNRPDWTDVILHTTPAALPANTPGR